MKNVNWKKVLAFLFVVAIVAFPMIAQTSSSSTQASTAAITNLKKVFATIYAFFSSTYMLVICTVGLVVIGIQMITNRGEPVVMKKLVPWLAAVFIIGGASGICALFFKPQVEVSGITSNATYIEGWN